ncbi:MAG: hypothetical protein SFX73_22620 [Kofleriaceae bacterium]|nr:hypothetical protein [Kofleriaceae bacterium]
MAVALWLVGLFGFVVAAVVASAKGRRAPADIVGRGVIASAAIAYAAIVVAAAWTWGGATASKGRTALIAKGAPVRVVLDGVRVPVKTGITVGRGPRAGVQLVGEGADEVARIEPRGDALVVRALAPRSDNVVVASVPAGAEAAYIATGRGCTADAAAFEVPVGATVVVTECAAGRPRQATEVRHASAGVVEVAPLVWRGRFVPERLIARAGDVVRVGAGEPVPGLASWDTIAPNGASAIVAIPVDPTDCAAWSIDGGGRHVSSETCSVTTGAFTLAVTPLVPDAAAVLARGVRTVLVVGAPALLVLIVLGAWPRHRRRTPVFAHALRLGVLGAALAAVACWRLMWAYRIDAMREAHALLAHNQLAVLAIGAACASNALLVLARPRADVVPGVSVQRAGGAMGAWTGWLVLSWLVADVPVPAVDKTTVGTLGLSVVAALFPLLKRPARSLANVPPELVLGVVAIGAVVARAALPRVTLCKLVLAYVVALAARGALRALLAAETSVGRRGRLVVALVAAAVAVASYDTGIALAIAGTGILLALLVAGHDAMYDATKSERIGLLEREYARVVWVQAIAAIALFAAIAAWAIAATDRELLVRGATAVTHAPLVMAAMFALAAVVARSHRRGWAPWVAASLAALALWGARADLVTRVIEGASTSARRVAAHVDPGYALLVDERAFAASVSAWREAALAPTADVNVWEGEGYFGARLRDAGVVRSLDNDYLPVLVARELGVGGLTQGIALLVLFAVGAGAIASARLPHTSGEHRLRTHAVAIVCVLALYQPLAALGVVPLTGISWPGLGIDSPTDLWLFVIGGVWCVLAGEVPPDDERVRATPRLVRARRLVLAALAVGGGAAVILVGRAGACALERVATDDSRIAAALRYADTLACDVSEGALPTAVGGTPTDDATARFDHELRAAFALARPALVEAASRSTCTGQVGAWALAERDGACVARLPVGWPAIEVAFAAPRARCRVVHDDAAIGVLRTRAPTQPAPRIRVVSRAMGAAAADIGELIAGGRVIRLRPGAPAVELAGLREGSHAAGKLVLAPGISVEADARGALLRGRAELFVTDGNAWRRITHGGELVLARMALIASGPAEHRTVVMFRPPRTWGTSAASVDPLLADDTRRLGDRTRRLYPYGDALPELGWVNPFTVERSLGLDGWIHAALAQRTPPQPACGTLAPPPIARDQVCTPSPVDGVLECRVSLQPELAQSLRGVVDALLADPKRFTGRASTPVRAAYVVLRGDTGELLAQGNVVPDRAALAYAPSGPRAEAELMRLREERGEADRERVEWNLPIAVGSTFKPILARAFELAAPQQAPLLALSAAGSVGGCPRAKVHPLLGHCPPTSLAGQPAAADLHEFLARSPNWYQAALGMLGLATPAGKLFAGDTEVTFDDVLASDLSSWPTDRKLLITDATGTILGKRTLSIDGLRRTPMWSSVEQLLGRPLCTLGDRATCERAAARADVCAARAFPVAAGPDLRYLVALGPDRVVPYADDRADQRWIPIAEYFQLLRGSGVHPIGSLAQLTDAFGRVVFDPRAQPQLAASWFPAPVTGTLPAWSCAAATGKTPTVLGADGGLCAVLRPRGTAHAGAGSLLAEPHVTLYGAKTGTIDSLADVARSRSACKSWNASHGPRAQLACGQQPADDSLFVVAFGVETPAGTIPITLGLQLQRSGSGAAATASPAFVRAIAQYLRGG